MHPSFDRSTRTDENPRPTWDNRDRSDRRGCPTPAFSRYWLVGRRRRNRRGTDPSRGYYVDAADGTWLAAVVALVAMILLDGTLTLHILANGGLEVNPVMNWVYGKGSGWFLGVKVSTAALAFPFLSVHRFFGLARAGVIMLLLAYGGVMLVHVHTLLRIYL